MGRDTLKKINASFNKIIGFLTSMDLVGQVLGELWDRSVWLSVFN